MIINIRSTLSSDPQKFSFLFKNLSKYNKSFHTINQLSSVVGVIKKHFRNTVPKNKIPQSKKKFVA
jgi:hypothetical protein